MTINYKKCPACGSKNTAKILYGEPGYEAYEREESGEIKLGGCCALVGGPEYHCNECKSQWNREQAIEAEYNKITRLKASVGGFFGDSFTIDINLDSLQVSWDRCGEGTEESIQKSIRRKTASNLKEELMRLGLLDWKVKYVEPGVLDGTHWSVEIQLDGRKVKKQGDNQFPEEWTAFCRLMRRISRRRFS